MTTTFATFNFNSNIYKAISVCGYQNPTPVQAQSIPEILAGRDVAVSAQTGTGKTAAFVLPALHHLSQQTPLKKPRVLVLTPTRELASQITKASALYGKFMRVNTVSIVGGGSYNQQTRDLSRGADIIVATPGRLMDHIEQKRIDLSHIEILVLDEADRMLDMGFIEDVQYIAKLTPAKRQTLLFSATLDNQLMKAVAHLLKNPIRIDLSEKTLASPQIKQEMYHTNNIQQKNRLLRHFLTNANIYKAIIFSATKLHADKLATQLRDEGFSAAALHGDLRQNVRTRTLDQLRRGNLQFLVATDVAARGIDISDITHVINFDLPRSCEDYVHRIGRTGRAGKSGIAISFVSPQDSKHIRNIERYMGQRIKLNDVNITHVPDKTAVTNSDSQQTEKNYAKQTRSWQDNEQDRPKSRQKPRREDQARSWQSSEQDGPKSRQKPRREDQGRSWQSSDQDRPKSRQKPRREDQARSWQSSEQDGPKSRQKPRREEQATKWAKPATKQKAKSNQSSFKKSDQRAQSRSGIESSLKSKKDKASFLDKIKSKIGFASSSKDKDKKIMVEYVERRSEKKPKRNQVENDRFRGNGNKYKGRRGSAA